MADVSVEEHAAGPPPEVPAAAPKSKKRVGWIVGGGVAAVAAIAVVIALVSGVFAGAPEEPAPAPKKVAVEPTPEPAPVPTPEPVVYPEATIDITGVLPMPYTEVWRPPDEGQNIWQIVDEEYGYVADGGTDFILAHTCENQACAGDGFRLLEEGSTFTYQGSLYQVEKKWQIMKVDIPEQDIWSHDPNRVVIITCIIETTWQASDKNEIFIATKVQ